MNIRSATAADVPGVLPLVAAICALHEAWDRAKYGFLPNPQNSYRRWLTARADDPRSVFLVAEQDDKIVAFLIGTVEQEIPIYRVEEFGFIHDVWVQEPYRHEGIGRQITMLAIERFKSMGITQIRLDTAFANDPARNLFASCGFRVSTMEMLLEIKPH
jgi:ribosomal protein S18 acetylase RimI-like enzyme